MRKLTAVWLILCLLGTFTSASAVELLPELDFSGKSMEVALSAEITQQMPFDEVRLGWLNDLVRHMRLVIRTSVPEPEQISQLSLQIDGNQVVGVTVKYGDGVEQAQFNVQPGVAYEGSEGVSALSILPGYVEPTGGIYGLDGTEKQWLEDGEALMYALLDRYAEDISDKSQRTKINGFATAERRKTLTIAKADAEDFRQELLGLCPEGKLKELLSGIVFGSKLSFVFNTMEDGTVIRVNLAGRAGVDSKHQRQVNLTVKLLGDEDGEKVSIELKSPAVEGQGNDYNTLIYDSEWTKDSGKTALESSFTYTRRIDKKKTVTSGKTELTRTESAEGAQVQGNITLENDPPEDDNAEGVTLDVNLNVRGEAQLDGTVKAERSLDGKVQQSAIIELEARKGAPIMWELPRETISLASLTPEQQTEIGEKLSKKVAAAVIRPLVLLPREETYYLSYDMPDDLWQQIVDAAQGEVQ